MTRFLKGTNDHDGDGHKGGSRKGGTTMAKAATPKKASTPRKPAARATREQNEALDAAAVSMATVPDPQSGGVNIVAEDELPSRAEVKKAQAEKIEGQFAEADAKGQPTSDEIAETRLGLAARGY